jgi:hypothetical protein
VLTKKTANIRERMHSKMGNLDERVKVRCLVCAAPSLFTQFTPLHLRVPGLAAAHVMPWGAKARRRR